VFIPDRKIERLPHMTDFAKVAVVLPVYNEAGSISAVLGEVNEAANRLLQEGVSMVVVLVDDDSPDGTAEVARSFAQRSGLNLHVVTGDRNGLGNAMLRGLAAAAEFAPTATVTLDADGQHNPADIPTLYRAFVARSADIVVGSRWVRGGRAPGVSMGRTAGSRAGNWLFRAVSGTRGVADATTSFRVYSPRVVHFLLHTNSSRYSGYSFFSTTIALAEASGYRISEVPIEFRPRFSGMSKLDSGEAKKYFLTLGLLRNERRDSTVAQGRTDYLAQSEMEWLDQAHAWNQFIVDSITSKMQTSGALHIAEVGAGVGAVTRVLLETFPRSTITSFEPDDTNFSRLQERFVGEPRVSTVNALFSNETGGQYEPFDCIVYVSVLEHVEFDDQELAVCFNQLKAGGELLVFVPAMESLYGPIDARSGHFRRYSKRGLTDLLAQSGFADIKTEYVDLLGILPYWLNYRLLNKAGMPMTSATLFNTVFVPATRCIDRVARRFPKRLEIGKNLVARASKPAGVDSAPTELVG
jgi:dolichol-phosphate mannosyltransferase